MQGSVAISPSPVMMDSAVFRHKLGLSLSGSVLSIDTVSPSKKNSCGVTARCLFGLPDPQLAKDLVKEVELKNALSFGKRFNFDIVNGEPFPCAKKLKLTHDCEGVSSSNIQKDSLVNDSDEENLLLEETEVEGYIWTETYDQDYMARCNKHAVNTSIFGPRQLAPLLFAPTISNRQFAGTPSPTCSPSVKSTSNHSAPTSISKLESSSTLEKNNNTEKRVSPISLHEKKNNRINNLHHHNLNSHSLPTSKRSTHSTAHQILTKYTNRVIKHTIMKKPRKPIITGTNCFFLLQFFKPYLGQVASFFFLHAKNGIRFCSRCCVTSSSSRHHFHGHVQNCANTFLHEDNFF